MADRKLAHREPIPPDTPALRAALARLRESKIGGLTVLDLRGRCSYTDFFVIGHGESVRQVQALADDVERAVREATGRAPAVEGYEAGEWVLIDCGDVIVHVFSERARNFYRIESLWYDAPVIDPEAAAR
ncbi:MAG: ribosome silencing factor [Acidobacteria bacterium]|nr:MAG: ribosome silencing factor [Acidobacteriota bacterium]